MSKINSVFSNRKGRFGVLIALCFIVPFLSVAITPASAGAPGSGWIQDRLVDDDTFDHETRPSMATDSNGHLYVAYEDYFPSYKVWGISVSKSTDGGNTWSWFDGWYYSSYNISYPSMAIDPSTDNIYVAYELEYSIVDHDIYCAVYNTTTSNWDYNGVDTDIEDDRYPSITSEYYYLSNYQYISYENLNSSNDCDLMFASSTDYGFTWSVKKIRGEFDSYVYNQTSITTARGSDGKDYIYIAYTWSQDYGSHSDIYVERSDDYGITWTQYLDIDGVFENCSKPSVAATHGGDTVVVAFQYAFDPSVYDYDIYYSYSNDNGATWDTGNCLAETVHKEIMPTLAVDGCGSTSNSIDGYIHVAYWDDYDIRHSKAHYSSLEPGDWSPPQIVNEANWASGVYSKPTITTHYRNDAYQPCIAWTDLRDTSYDIYYSTTETFTTPDTTPPTIDMPADITYEENTTGHSITWNPSDANPSSYIITRNNTFVDGGPWDGSPITINVDGLSVGTYVYNCTVYDEADNSASDTVIVIVTEASSQDEGNSDDENGLFEDLFGDSDVGMYAAIGVSVGFAAYLARSLSRSLRRRQAGPWDEDMDDDFFKV